MHCGQNIAGSPSSLTIHQNNKQKQNLGKIHSRPITTLAAQRMDAARLNGLFPFGCDVSKKRSGKASYDYRILKIYSTINIH